MLVQRGDDPVSAPRCCDFLLTLAEHLSGMAVAPAEHRADVFGTSAAPGKPPAKPCPWRRGVLAI